MKATQGFKTGTVYKCEPIEVLAERQRILSELSSLGCSSRQASSLSYRLVPRKYLTEAEMKQLGYDGYMTCP